MTQQAKMTGRTHTLGTANRSWEVIVGFVLATLFCKLDGATAQGLNLLHKTAWVALVILGPVIMVAAWQADLAYLCKDSRFFAAFEFEVSIWPLLRVIAGKAQ